MYAKIPNLAALRNLVSRGFDKVGTDTVTKAIAKLHADLPIADPELRESVFNFINLLSNDLEEFCIKEMARAVPPEWKHAFQIMSEIRRACLTDLDDTANAEDTSASATTSYSESKSARRVAGKASAVAKTTWEGDAIASPSLDDLKDGYLLMHCLYGHEFAEAHALLARNPKLIHHEDFRGSVVSFTAGIADLAILLPHIPATYDWCKTSEKTLPPILNAALSGHVKNLTLLLNLGERTHLGLKPKDMLNVTHQLKTFLANPHSVSSQVFNRSKRPASDYAFCLERLSPLETACFERASAKVPLLSSTAGAEEARIRDISRPDVMFRKELLAEFLPACAENGDSLIAFIHGLKDVHYTLALRPELAAYRTAETSVLAEASWYPKPANLWAIMTALGSDTDLCQPETGMPPILWAARYGQLENMLLLLAAGDRALHRLTPEQIATARPDIVYLSTKANSRSPKASAINQFGRSNRDYEYCLTLVDSCAGEPASAAGGRRKREREDSDHPSSCSSSTAAESFVFRPPTSKREARPENLTEGARASSQP